MMNLGKTRTWLAPLASAALAAAAQAAPIQVAGASDSRGMARAQRQIEEREYHASRNQRGLQAPNRPHNLRAYFEPGGLRLHDRSAPGEPELMALRLAALGRAGSERPVPAGEVSSDGARVEIRRPGLVEWYLNAGVGLEQGFTLDERPEGAGRLSLKLALSSGSARSAGVGAALLRAESGRELRYAGLAVVDAGGRSMPAELFVTEPHELRIEVDDAGAAYPLTVDPLVTAVPDAVLQGDQNDARVAQPDRLDGGGPEVALRTPRYVGKLVQEARVLPLRRPAVQPGCSQGTSTMVSPPERTLGWRARVGHRH